MGTFTKLTYHVVFGTKRRHKSIYDAFQQKLYEYIGGLVRAQNGHLIEVGGIEDHIHLLLNISPTKSVSDAIRDLKAGTSKWSNQSSNDRGRFEWQKGFGAFTVSYSQLETVRHYIQNQREHHKHKSFEDEYVSLLNNHGVLFEKQYLFEGEYCG